MKTCSLEKAVSSFPSSYRVQTALLQVHFFLTQQEAEQAGSVLDMIQTDDVALLRETMYLRAWCAFQRGDVQEVIILARPLLTPTIQQLVLEAGSEREHRARALFVLSQVAQILNSAEEALLHGTYFQEFLQKQHLSLPVLRILVRSTLAWAALHLERVPQAIHHAKWALRLSQKEAYTDALPALYVTLCEAYLLNGALEAAATAGQEALRLAAHGADEVLLVSLHSCLGRLALHQNHPEVAVQQFRASLNLALSTAQPKLVFMSSLALVEQFLSQQQWDAAMQVCQQALDTFAGVDDAHMQGTLCALCAKIVLMAASPQKSEEQKSDEALAWLELAGAHLHTLSPSQELAQVFATRARILELLGRWEEALLYWHAAYEEYARLSGKEHNG